MNLVLSSMRWLFGTTTLGRNPLMFIKSPEKVTGWDLIFIILGTLFTIGILAIIFVLTHVCGHASKQMNYLKKVKRYYGQGMAALEADAKEVEPK